MSAWNVSRAFPAPPSVLRKSLHVPGRREPTAVCSERERRGSHDGAAHCEQIWFTVGFARLQYTLHTPALSWLIRIISMSDGSLQGLQTANKPQRVTATPWKMLTCFCLYTGSVHLPSFSPHCPVSASLLLILIGSSVEWEFIPRGPVAHN